MTRQPGGVRKVSHLTYTGFTPTFAERSNWTLPQVLARRARTHGDKTFLDVPDSGVRLTYGEVHGLSKRIANGLASDGHAPGDRVVIMLSNRLEYLLAWFGSALAGMAEVPINTAYRGSFLEHQVSTVAPTAVVTSPEYAPRFVESKDACGSVRTVYVVGESADSNEEVLATVAMLRSAGLDARPFTDLLSAADSEPLAEPLPHDLAAIFFTSGTTGLSKGVAMSHSQLYFFADEGVSLVRLTDADTYLSVGPLFHGNAQFLAAYPAMIVGGRFVLHAKFSATRWTTWIRDSGATVTNLVGVMSDFLWKQPPATGRRGQSIAVRVGGAQPDGGSGQVQGAIRHRGTCRELRSHRDLDAHPHPVRSAAPTRCGRARCRRLVRRSARRPSDR